MPTLDDPPRSCPAANCVIMGSWTPIEGEVGDVVDVGGDALGVRF